MENIIKCSSCHEERQFFSMGMCKKCYYVEYHLNHTLLLLWHSMKQRCCNEKHIKYKFYGARGIKIHDEWLDYKIFETWCLKHGWKRGLSIDRINNNGNYEPNNCHFITKREHAIKSGKERAHGMIICEGCHKLKCYRAKNLCKNCCNKKYRK